MNKEQIIALVHGMDGMIAKASLEVSVAKKITAMTEALMVALGNGADDLAVEELLAIKTACERVLKLAEGLMGE